MGLHQHKTFTKMGLPEALILFLLAITILPISLFWLSDTPWNWRMTDGEVVNGYLLTTHTNAQDYPTKVSIAYRYRVDGSILLSTWEGFWPPAKSPNALPSSALNVLKRTGHPLVVLYDPNNPKISRLHYAGQDQQMFYGMLSVGFSVISILYCLKIYPVWRHY